MPLNSEIIDRCVLVEAFSTYSEEELRRWGAEGGETVEVKIESTKRIFRMKFDILERTEKVSVLFRDPDGNVAVRITGGTSLWPEDTLYITYTVTAYPGDGPDSCRVRSPNGKYLTVTLYSSAT